MSSKPWFCSLHSAKIHALVIPTFTVQDDITPQGMLSHDSPQQEGRRAWREKGTSSSPLFFYQEENLPQHSLSRLLFTSHWPEVVHLPLLVQSPAKRKKIDVFSLQNAQSWISYWNWVQCCLNSQGSVSKEDRGKLMVSAILFFFPIMGRVAGRSGE